MKACFVGLLCWFVGQYRLHIEGNLLYWNGSGTVECPRRTLLPPNLLIFAPPPKDFCDVFCVARYAFGRPWYCFIESSVSKKTQRRLMSWWSCRCSQSVSDLAATVCGWQSSNRSISLRFCACWAVAATTVIHQRRNFLVAASQWRRSQAWCWLAVAYHRRRDVVRQLAAQFKLATLTRNTPCTTQPAYFHSLLNYHGGSVL